jgi:hypothetical protein
VTHARNALVLGTPAHFCDLLGRAAGLGKDEQEGSLLA